MVKNAPELAVHVTVYEEVPLAEGWLIVPPAVTAPLAVLVLLKVTGPLSKPGDSGVVVFVMASRAASAMVRVPEQLLPLQLSVGVGEETGETDALAATPLSVNVESVLLPAWRTYVASFSAKTFVPLSISTAKGYEEGTAPAKRQLIVQLGGEHEPEPAALDAPLMNKAAWVVAGETYRGFRVLLDLAESGNTIVKVPYAAAAACETGLATGGRPFTPTPEHAATPAASTTAIGVDGTMLGSFVVNPQTRRDALGNLARCNIESRTLNRLGFFVAGTNSRTSAPPRG